MSADGRPLATARRRAQRGVGLIEVLVAMLVLAVGFLAIGSMQVRALRDNQHSHQVSQARLLLADMMDRMRDNPAGVRDGAYAGARTDAVDAATDACTASACGAGELAARDLAEWRASLDPATTALQPRLPRSGGETAEPALGEIVRAADGTYTISLTWQALVDGELAEQVVEARFLP